MTVSSAQLMFLLLTHVLYSGCYFYFTQFQFHLSYNRPVTHGRFFTTWIQITIYSSCLTSSRVCRLWYLVQWYFFNSLGILVATAHGPILFHYIPLAVFSLYTPIVYFYLIVLCPCQRLYNSLRNICGVVCFRTLVPAWFNWFESLYSIMSFQFYSSHIRSILYRVKTASSPCSTVCGILQC